MLPHHVHTVALIACLAVAGCADSLIIYEPTHAQNYVNGDFERATSKGELLAIIHASAPSVPRVRLEALITGYMAAGSRHGKVRFVTAPSDKADPDYRMVVMFNGPVGVGSYDLCAAGAKFELRPFGDPLTMMGAFCYREHVLSEASGRIGGVASPEDARTRSLVAAVVAALQPIYDRWDVGDGGWGR